MKTACLLGCSMRPYMNSGPVTLVTCQQQGNKSQTIVESSWNVMAHGDAREGKWGRNWRMEGVANTLHTTSELGVCSINNADAHTSAVSSRLNWRPRRFKRTCPFRRKTKSGLCACAITFRTQSTIRGGRGVWRHAGYNRFGREFTVHSRVHGAWVVKKALMKCM
jgi:hypothetical protein